MLSDESIHVLRCLPLSFSVHMLSLIKFNRVLYGLTRSFHCTWFHILNHWEFRIIHFVWLMIVCFNNCTNRFVNVIQPFPFFLERTAKSIRYVQWRKKRGEDWFLPIAKITSRIRAHINILMGLIKINLMMIKYSIIPINRVIVLGPQESETSLPSICKRRFYSTKGLEDYPWLKKHKIWWTCKRYVISFQFWIGYLLPPI